MPPPFPQKSFTERFGVDAQERILGGVLSLPDLYPSLRPLLRDIWFDDALRAVVGFMHEHHDKFGALPTQVFVEGWRKRPFPVPEPGVVNPQWLAQEAKDHARYKAQEHMILEGVNWLQSDRMDLFHAAYEESQEIGAGEPDAPPFATLWIDETHKVPPPEYLIAPWLMRDTVTCLYGAPGSFKSFFALHAALCLATGTPWNGQPVPKVPVIYVAAEGQGGIALREDAWKACHHVTPARGDLVNITEPLRLLDPAHVSLFIAYVQRLEQQHGTKFGLLVLDTYSQCIAGHDENSTEVGSAASAAMIRLRRELGVTVLFVHHEGKDKARGMRGAGALRANTDAAIEISRSESALLAEAHVERMKDGEAGARIPFTLRAVPVPRLAGARVASSLVCDIGGELAPGQAAPSTTMDRMQERLLLRSILQSLTEGESRTVAGLTGTVPGMHANPHYKAKVAAALPLDAEVEVRDGAGEVLGVLCRRLAPGLPAHRFGEVACLRKSGQAAE